MTEAVVDQNILDAVLLPRDGLVSERRNGEFAFGLVEGPFRSYQRNVTIDTLGDGSYAVTQTIDAEMAIPFWGWLFRVPFARELRRLEPSTSGKAPWWAPPDRLDEEAARTLAALAMLSAVLGYATILLSQLITYAASEYGVGKSAQGVALAAVRFDILLSFPLVAMTDRRGRRRVLLWASAVAFVVTAAAAAAPSLAGLIALQVPARGLLTAANLIVLIVTAEEMPRGARAYAVGLITMAGGLGDGVCVLLLPVADISTGSWRLLFALAVLGLLPLRRISAALPETRRFRVAHPEVDMAGHGARLWLLAVSAFLLAVFFTPALQFTNEFLRDDRGFSGARIALFTTLTTIPGAIGIIGGGRIADVRGRRFVAAIALVVGAVTGVLMFATRGWPLWAWSAIGSTIGAATVPALSVYGPELFPTSLRGRANAILGIVGRAGSVVGLIAVGVLADARSFGTAFAIVSVGPLLLAVLVIAAYPETAHRSLEDLNPEDA